MGIDNNKGLLTADELRRRAEERLGENRGTAHLIGAEADPRFLHELQVHQIELEMQNVELRQARDELEAALEQYTDLYDFAPIGYFTLDGEGVIRAANLTGAAFLGIERSLLTGRRIDSFVSVTDRPAFAAFLGKVLTSAAKESCELALEKKGDSKRFIQIEGVAAASGQECLAAIIDISERRQLEEKLASSEKITLVQAEKLRTLLDAAPAIIWIAHDRESRSITGNRAAQDLLRMAPDEEMSKTGTAPENLAHFRVFKDGVELSGHDLPIQRVVSSGQPLTDYEYDIAFNDGTVRSLLGNIIPLHDAEGRPEGAIAAMLDITEYKQAEEVIERLNTNLVARSTELEAANIELEAFNYTVSHDLRRPLTVINGYCQLVRELCGNKLDEKSLGYIQEIYDGTLRMNRLIDTLLDFSRITRGEMSHGKVDLSKMAEEVAMELKSSKPERRVTFRIAEGIMTAGDTRLLRVVLDNLIGNAWKYTDSREETVIEFGVTEVDGKTACFVRDNGPGFDMAHADKLFIPFLRLPGTNVEGYGIGLATVERIVWRHGGGVWAESEPGKGATFLFTLETPGVVRSSGELRT